MQVTLDLPEPVIARATELAAGTRRDYRAVLAEVLVTSLPPQEDRVEERDDISALSDAEVLRISQSFFSGSKMERWRELHEAQNLRGLSAAESDELATIVHEMNEGNLRKADAIVEAVRRGLRSRLDAPEAQC